MKNPIWALQVAIKQHADAQKTRGVELVGALSPVLDPPPPPRPHQAQPAGTGAGAGGSPVAIEPFEVALVLRLRTHVDSVLRPHQYLQPRSEERRQFVATTEQLVVAAASPLGELVEDWPRSEAGVCE